MYDPARDDDPHPHRYSVRLVFIALSTIAFCAAIFPAVSGFQPKVGTSTGDTCFAVRDGWHADRPLTAVQQGGTGACVPEARHRLIVSGLMLSVAGAFVGSLVAIARRRRRGDGNRNGRPEGRPLRLQRT